MPTATLAVVVAESIWHRYRRNRSLVTRDQLAKEHDKLALKIAYRMSLQCAEPIEDLIQMARVGLLKAIDKFDPDAQNAFSSFAVPYIRGEIQHFLRDHWQHLKIPRRTFEKANEIKRDHRRLEQLGRVVSLDQVAAAHQIDRDQWQWMSAAVQRKPFMDLESAMHLSAEADSDDRSLQSAVMTRLAQLPKLHHAIVIEKFFRQLSEGEIACRHSCTLEEIQALLADALSQLKSYLEAIA